MNVNVTVGVVTSSEVKANKDAEDKSVLLQCEMTQADDVQTVELYAQAGEDGVPPDGSTVVIVEAGKSWKIAVAVDDGIESAVQKGERLLYSTDNGGPKQATIYLKKDGVIEVNGNTDNAVRFSSLKSGFDTLKTELAANLSAISTAISSLGGTYVVAPLTASVDAAKIDEIKVP